MQAVLVEGKVELIILGGYIIIFLIIIDILKMKLGEDFHLQIIVQLQGNIIKRLQIHIILGIAL